MTSFRHITAHTLAACISLLTEHSGRTKVNAGGTDLLGVLKERILPESPEIVINIKEIPDMDTLREEKGVLKIGALTRLSTIAESPLVHDSYASLAQAAGAVATPVIRTMATLGGNLCQDVRCWYYRYPHDVGGRILCHRKGGNRCPAVAGDNRYHAVMGIEKCAAVCPSDTAVALTALNADIRIMGPGGERIVPVRQFYTPLGNVLDPDEIVTEVQVPRPSPASTQSFVKLSLRRPVDFALVSAASVIGLQNGACTDARICLGAVAPAPVRAAPAEQMLVGNPLTEDLIHAAASAAVAGAAPLGKNAYKVELAKAVLRKTLKPHPAS